MGSWDRASPQELGTTYVVIVTLNDTLSAPVQAVDGTCMVISKSCLPPAATVSGVLDEMTVKPRVISGSVKVQVPAPAVFTRSSERLIELPVAKR
jgi:hypothetical protein